MTGPPQYFKQFERKKSPKDKLDFATSVLAKLVGGKIGQISSL